MKKRFFIMAAVILLIGGIALASTDVKLSKDANIEPGSIFAISTLAGQNDAMGFAQALAGALMENGFQVTDGNEANYGISFTYSMYVSYGIDYLTKAHVTITDPNRKVVATISYSSWGVSADHAAEQMVKELVKKAVKG